MLENALNVSDYTDTVDVWNRQTKVSRVFSALRDVLSISAGLTVRCVVIYYCFCHIYALCHADVMIICSVLLIIYNNNNKNNIYNAL